MRILTLTASLALAAAISLAGTTLTVASPLFAGAGLTPVGDVGLIDLAQYGYHGRHHHHHRGWGHRHHGWGHHHHYRRHHHGWGHHHHHHHHHHRRHHHF